MVEGGESSNKAEDLDKTQTPIRKYAGIKLMKVSGGVESVNVEILHAVDVTETPISKLPEEKVIGGLQSLHPINTDGAGTFAQIANEIHVV